MSNNQIFIAAGRAITTVSDSDNSIFGSNATTDEVVKITDATATNIIVDANVERVQFTGASTDYKYLVVGTNLKIYNAAGTLVSTIGVQADETAAQLAAGAKLGTQLTFANGTVDAKITGLNAITIGDQAVSTTTATAVVIPTAKIDTSLASAPIPSFSVTGAATATEGGNALFTVTLANPSATATTVKYALTNLTTTTSADYGTAVTAGTNVTDAAGTLTFAPGATTATITVPVTFDSLVETGEGVTLTLSAPSAGIVSSTGAAITTAFADAPAPTFTMTSSATAGISTQEGRTITFTVTPTGIVNAQTVLNLNMVGSALGAITATTSAADFTTASPLIFAAGDTAAKTVTVTVVNDSVTEGLEAYKAQLLDSSYNEKAAIQGTVADATPTVTLTAGATSVNEGAALTFTATSDMAAPAGGLVVPVTFGGTATAADYTTSATSITIAAGATTGTLTLNAIADNLTDGADTVTATLGNVNGATTVTTPVSATINDTSLALAANAFSLSGAATANEGTSVVYTITRGAAATVATTVPYTITGTATSGSDYTAQTGTATFAIGATTATITLPITADLLTETSETVIVTLGTPSVATDIVTTGAGTVTTTIADTSTTAVASVFNLTSSSNTTTNGIDNVSGTTYNSINALMDYTNGSTATTWNLTDSIAPAASVNAALNLIIVNGSATNTPSGYAASNIATLNLKVIDSAATAQTTTFDMASVTGVATANVASSSTIGTTADTARFTGIISTATKLGVSNNGQYTNVTGEWASTAVTGAADTANLVLAGRNGTITVGTGFETLAVTTSGTGNYEAGLTGYTSGTATLKTVTVTGSDLRVDSTLDAGVTSFDATNASGTINVVATPGTTFNAKGGSATTDVIQLAAAGTAPTISAFEKVVAGVASTFDLTNVTGVTALGVAAGVAGNVAFTNTAATATTLNFSSSLNTVRPTDVSATGNLSTGGSVTYGLKTATGAADTLAVTFDNQGTANTSTTGYVVSGLVATAVENINITTADWKTVSLGGLTQTVSSGAATVTATGSANLAIGAVAAVTGGTATSTNVYNFGGITGTLSADFALETGNISVTGAVGNDTIIQAATDDSKTATYNLGAGADVFTLTQTTGSGTTAALIAKSTINGEAGDDVINWTTDAAVGDANNTFSINGGDGTDTVVAGALIAARTLTASISNIEKINLQNVAAGLTTLALTVDGTTATSYASMLITDVSGKANAIGVTSTGNLDLSAWTSLGLDASDTFALTGSGTIKAPTAVHGASGNNGYTINGGTSADTITDSSGADTITGGVGSDTISISNGGTDVIIFQGYATNGVDVITGFTPAGTDVIKILTTDTTMTTAAASAVIIGVSTALVTAGAAWNISGSINPAAEDVIEVTTTLDTAVTLSASSTGADLLQALSSDTTAAASITVDTAGDKYDMVVYQNGNAYIWNINSAGVTSDTAVTATEITLIGVVNTITAAAFAANDFMMV